MRGVGSSANIVPTVEKMKPLKDSAVVTMVIVCCALFQDNILLSVVLPILPEYFYHAEREHIDVGFPGINPFVSNLTSNGNCTGGSFLRDENIYFGILVSMKPIVQLLVSFLVGKLANRVGYDLPMFIGYSIIIGSSLLFGFGKTYTVLMVARSLQGAGSSCFGVAGFGMISDAFPDQDRRSKMIGIALASFALGVLVGPIFGSVTYQFAGKAMPFLIITGFTSIVFVIHVFGRSIVIQRQYKKNDRASGFCDLLKDTYMLLCAVALFAVTVSCGVLESGQSLWMMKYMCPTKWMLGVAFVPENVFYIIGVTLLPRIIPNAGRWIALSTGLVLTGLACILLPFSPSVWILFGPGSLWGLGFAIVDVTVYIIMGELVDRRHFSSYAHVFAIADFTFNLSYAVGPLLTGLFVPIIGFRALMISVGVLTFICAPIGFYLRDPPTRDEEAMKRLLTRR